MMYAGLHDTEQGRVGIERAQTRKNRWSREYGTQQPHIASGNHDADNGANIPFEHETDWDKVFDVRADASQPTSLESASHQIGCGWASDVGAGDPERETQGSAS